MKTLPLLIIPLLVLACERHHPAPKDQASPGASPAVRAPEAVPGPAKKPAAVAGDPEIVAHLERIARVCDVQPWGARVTCPNREEDQLRSWYATGKKTLAALVDAAAGVMTARDEVGQAAAVDALRRVVNNLEPRELVSRPHALAFGPENWRRFRQAADRITNPRLYIALDSSLAVLASLAGQEAAFFEMVSSRPSVRIRALPHLMRFSRLRAFEELRRILDTAMGSGDLPLVVAGLSSAARLPEPTPEEVAVLCPWAQRLFVQSPQHLWTNVAKIYRSCPQQVGGMVDHLEKEWRPATATSAEVAVVGDLMKAHCKDDVAPGKAGASDPATAVSLPECRRLRDLIVRIRDSPETRPEVRRVCEAVAPVSQR